MKIKFKFARSLILLSTSCCGVLCLCGEGTVAEINKDRSGKQSFEIKTPTMIFPQGLNINKKGMDAANNNAFKDIFFVDTSSRPSNLNGRLSITKNDADNLFISNKSGITVGGNFFVTGVNNTVGFSAKNDLGVNGEINLKNLKGDNFNTNTNKKLRIVVQDFNTIAPNQSLLPRSGTGNSDAVTIDYFFDKKVKHPGGFPKGDAIRQESEKGWLGRYLNTSTLDAKKIDIKALEVAAQIPQQKPKPNLPPPAGVPAPVPQPLAANNAAAAQPVNAPQAPVQNPAQQNPAANAVNNAVPAQVNQGGKKQKRGKKQQANLPPPAGVPAPAPQPLAANNAAAAQPVNAPQAPVQNPAPQNPAANVANNAAPVQVNQGGKKQKRGKKREAVPQPPKLRLAPAQPVVINPGAQNLEAEIKQKAVDIAKRARERAQEEHNEQVERLQEMPILNNVVEEQPIGDFGDNEIPMNLGNQNMVLQEMPILNNVVEEQQIGNLVDNEIPMNLGNQNMVLQEMPILNNVVEEQPIGDFGDNEIPMNLGNQNMVLQEMPILNNVVEEQQIGNLGDNEILMNLENQNMVLQEMPILDNVVEEQPMGDFGDNELPMNLGNQEFPLPLEPNPVPAPRAVNQGMNLIMDDMDWKRFDDHLDHFRDEIRNRETFHAEQPLTHNINDGLALGSSKLTPTVVTETPYWGSYRNSEYAVQRGAQQEQVLPSGEFGSLESRDLAPSSTQVSTQPISMITETPDDFSDYREDSFVSEYTSDSEKQSEQPLPTEEVNAVGSVAVSDTMLSEKHMDSSPKGLPEQETDDFFEISDLNDSFFLPEIQQEMASSDLSEDSKEADLSTSLENETVVGTHSSPASEEEVLDADSDENSKETASKAKSKRKPRQTKS